MSITRKNTKWGRWIAAAKERGFFTPEEIDAVMDGQACCVGELFERKLLEDDPVLLKMFHYDFPNAVRSNQLKRVDLLYTKLLEIRNTQYE